MTRFKSTCEELTDIIKASYEEGVTLSEAEKLAGKFLYAQMLVSQELKNADLDSRMKKSGLKSLKAALYISEVQKNEKKPSDTLLNNLVDSHEVVVAEQSAFDQAEVDRDELERYYSIFKEAHVYYRGIAKGKFE